MKIQYEGNYVDYFNVPPTSWKRENGPLRVWRNFEGRKKMADGEVPKFSIQEVPKELYEDVVDFMDENYLAGEALSVNLDLGRDPVGIREHRTLWRFILDQGISIVALKENSDPNAKPVIAGVNILCFVTPELEVYFGELINHYRSEKLKKMMVAMMPITFEAEVWEKFGIDIYMNALGLVVRPDFRGLGLAEELLRTREDICRAYQVSLTKTIFTATASQIAASRAGFEVLLQRRYSEILDDEGNVFFPGIPVEFVKVMVKKFD